MLPAIGGEHEFGEWEILQKPTCTGYGECRRACAKCGLNDYEIEEATGHIYGDWIWDEVNMFCYRVCHCGAMQGFKFNITIDGENGPVIILPDNPEYDFDVENIVNGDSRFVLVEEVFSENLEGDWEIHKVFDITLKNSDGVHVQPDGTVKVKLPLHSEKDGVYKVYRVNDDGTLTDMNAYRQGSHMVFETDHFSTYVFAEAMMDSSSVGMMIVLYIVVAIVLVVAFGCIIFFHKNQKRNIAGSRG